MSDAELSSKFKAIMEKKKENLIVSSENEKSKTNYEDSKEINEALSNENRNSTFKRNSNFLNLVKRFQNGDTKLENKNQEKNEIVNIENKSEATVIDKTVIEDIPNIHSLGSETIEIKPRSSTHQRNSAHRKNILNKMKNTINNTYESNNKIKEEKSLPNSESEPIIQIKTEEDARRPSVKDLISMNEMRLRGKSIPEKRNTVAIYNSNKNEITEKIRKLLEENNRDTEIIDENDSFIKNKILQMGICDKDFKELVHFFNRESASKLNIKHNQKQRNTVNYSRASSFQPFDIPEIKEEKDEDKSVKSISHKSNNHDNQSRYSNMSADQIEFMSNEVELFETKFEQEEIKENNNIEIKDETKPIGKYESNYLTLGDKNKLDISNENNFNYCSNLTRYSSFNKLEINSIIRNQIYEPNNQFNKKNSFNRTSSNQSMGETILEVNSVNDIHLISNKKINNIVIQPSESINYLSNVSEPKPYDEIPPLNINNTNILKNHNKLVYNSIKEETLLTQPKIEMTNHDHSRYQKNIINSLDSIAITQYTINPNLPFDPTFYDILCIHCYECVKPTEVDKHSEYCVIHPDDYADLYLRTDADEDYNARIYKLHESLKKKKYDIYKVENDKLYQIYNELVSLIYEILINNNSIEELEKSISKINDIINNMLPHINSNYKFLLLIYSKRISQLVYIKLNEMEKLLVYIKNKNEILEDSQDNLSNNDIEDDPEMEDRLKLLKLELANIEKQTEKTKMEVEQWRQEAKLRENMLARPNTNMEILSDIVSDVLSRRDESFDGMTMVTGQTSELDIDIANMKDVNEELDIKTEEERKKYFLSIGLSIKFKYSDKLSDNISIADLYDKAKEKNVHTAEWYNFIMHELNLN